MTVNEPNPPHPSSMLAQLVYSPKEVEGLLGLSKNTVNALLRSGRLRSVRVGRRYLIPREAISEFLNQQAA